MPDSKDVYQSLRNTCRALPGDGLAGGHILNGRKVLFVDDDPEVRAIFRRSFDYTGADIHLAANSADAISLAATTEYCVVVTDLQMPGLTGIELIDALWHERLPTSFILVTGLVQLNLPTNGPSARAISSVVRKPWLPEHIDFALVQATELYDRRTRELTKNTQIIRLLLVEDDAVEPKLNQNFLADNANIQFEYRQVSRLGAGIIALEQEQHDIILCDLSLPDARGLDAVAELKRAAPRLPIVVLSGSHDEDLAIQAVQAGAQDYIAKDEITAKSLRRTLRYALERKNTEEHVSYLEHHDQLTGLANRALFSKRATASISQASARNSKPALLMLDLDRFRTTNDLLGHNVGDILLTQVTDRLLEHIPTPDGIARIGADEFVLLIEQSAGHGDASNVAQKLLDALRNEFIVDEHTISISGSVGISVFPENGNNAEQLLANANAAVYRAKAAGRNCYQFFDETMHREAVERMDIERELHNALARDQFEVYYQPQVGCHTNKIVCFEALLRWTHPRLGSVGPFRFIPILEANRSIHQVGAWVLHEACQQVAFWRKTAPNLRISVNVSAVQFEDDELDNIVNSALKKASLPAEALELEITEGLLMKDFSHTLQTLEKLSSSGVRIAIDDFGTGYSNLSYIARYPIDVLKIDKSITDMIGTHNGDSINFAVIQLGKALGIKTLAEGVETEKQRSFLCDAAVNMYQGYLFSKPMTADNCSEVLDSASHCRVDDPSFKSCSSE